MESTPIPGIEKPADPQSTPIWLKRVPMVTGVLAGLAGFLTVKGANLSNQAIYNSNQAVLHQAKSSDYWTEYQANSVKRHIDETAIKVGIADPVARAALQAEANDLHNRQAPLAASAKAEEQLRENELHNGAQRLAQKDLMDYAGVGAQIGIALASVAALTRKKAAFTAGVVLGLIAIVVTGYGLVSPFIAHLFGHH